MSFFRQAPTGFLIQLIVLCIGFGLAIGIGGYTFFYAKGASYMTNDPGACANCHIMNEQYEGWLKSSHRKVAVCNDCHTPPGFVSKYMSKASNGFWHSFAFTTGKFHEPIRIKAHNREITEQTCRKCHEGLVQGIEGVHSDERISCISCHRSVGHLH
jgi:cytochrome c nitrite reductase small subunit